MEKISRRDFTRKMFGTICSMTLVTSLCEAQVLKGSVKPIAHKWVFEMERICRDLRGGRIKHTDWQDQIETLLAQVDLTDLLRAIDYDRLSKTAKFFDDHETAEDVTFDKVKKLPDELSFAPYFYAMKKGVSVVPHGHRNMTTMHMMLKGEAYGRHYDRIADEAEHLIIKPTKDKMLTAGAVSTISDERDNIHWFKATSETVFMFNVGVYRLNAGAATTGRDYIDPNRGEKLTGGSLRVPLITHDDAYRIYGKSENFAVPRDFYQAERPRILQRIKRLRGKRFL